MANLVITIGRENGSGGRQLGSELAAALGVKCYDSELINETAKASGFAKSFVETHYISSFFSNSYNFRNYCYDRATNPALAVNHF